MRLLLLFLKTPLNFINVHEPIHRPTDACPRILVNLVVNTLALLLLVNYLYLIICLHLILTAEIRFDNHRIELLTRLSILLLLLLQMLLLLHAGRMSEHLRRVIWIHLIWCQLVLDVGLMIGKHQRLFLRCM